LLLPLKISSTPTRPDLSYEQAQELAQSLPTADERGRPIINLVFGADDCVL
jgi:hypothetical protein